MESCAVVTSQTNYIEIEVDLLQRILSAVILSACVDPTRPHMHGVLIRDAGAEGCTFVATDGHTLARYDIPFGSATDTQFTTSRNGTFDISLHIETAKQIIKACKACTEPRFRITQDRAVCGDISIPVIPMADGFPPFEQVTPKPAKRTFSGAAMSPHYLARAAKAFELVLPKKSKRGPVTDAMYLEPNGGPLDPLVFSSAGCGLVFIVMPMRADMGASRRIPKSAA